MISVPLNLFVSPTKTKMATMYPSWKVKEPFWVSERSMNSTCHCMVDKDLKPVSIRELWLWKPASPLDSNAVSTETAVVADVPIACADLAPPIQGRQGTVLGEQVVAELQAE
jgi:hypothetical protein